MAKKLDPQLLEILTTYGERPEDALWDCHGTWVAYHKAIERIAAKAGVKYAGPSVLVAQRDAAAILVTGTLGDRTEWSIGEAAIDLNYRVSGKQAAYPFAMAEKRAKDRVVLKLIGLHGLVYSEEESDDFKPKSAGREPDKSVADYPHYEAAPPKLRDGLKTNKITGRTSANSLKQDKSPDNWDAFETELLECQSVADLTKLALSWSSISERDVWPTSWHNLAKSKINERREELINGIVPDDDVFPGDRPNTYVDNFIP